VLHRATFDLVSAEAISHGELRNESGRILREVQQGQSFIITNNGEPVAEIRPLTSDLFAGLTVSRAKPGARFRDIVPVEVESDETALEALRALRGDR